MTGHEDWYMYDGADVTADYSRTSGSGTFTLERTYANGRAIDSKIARIDAGAPEVVYFYVGDAIGTVHEMIDTSGAVQRRVLTTAWGEDLPGFTPLETVADRHGLAQRENDGESGLMHYRARSYDPRVGRFLQSDPIIKNRPSEHYNYAQNDPVSKSDPSGLLTIVVHGTWAKDDTWWRTSGGFSKELDKKVADVWKISTAKGKAVSDVQALAGFGPDGMFQWTGADTSADRETGATRLKEYIDAVKKLYPDEPIRVVAHSHGGNVAKRATALGAKMDALALLATPHGEDVDKKVDDPERYLYTPNPANVKSRILNLYNTQDIVQNVGATALPGEGGRNIEFVRTDRNPAMKEHYDNRELTVTVNALRAHAIMHSVPVAQSLGNWITTGKFTDPGVLWRDTDMGN